eukprot:TRINITY_DN4402_c0_g3_i1.p1 TRINITY_DN4402_c0_g3~~TRINITY_DN4402_c0_g3_i1.p1  ORF type:complete len:407 (-),score=36.07 TRINITY_DN4402_c0_g3_i1:195-1415(-)
MVRFSLFQALCAVSATVGSSMFVGNGEIESINVSGLRDDIGTCQSMVEQKDIVVIQDIIKEFRPDAVFPDDESVLSEWAHVQSQILDTAFPGFPRDPASAPLSILIVQAVKFESAPLFESNLRHLGRPQATTIKWAHFYYDSKIEQWDGLDWYTRNTDIIIRRNIPPGGCENSHFNLVEDVSSFDYVWLLDEDINLMFMNFTLYELVLRSLKPVASQPSVLAGVDGGISSGLPGLPMRPAANGKFMVAAENEISEVMCPVISTRLWPALRMWMSRKSNHCDSDVSRLWDLGAVLSKMYCKTAAIVIVNAAPVSHVDCKTNTESGTCWHDCGEDGTRPLNQAEARAVAKVCELIPHNWLMKHGCDQLSVFGCVESLRQTLQNNTWSVPVRKRAPLPPPAIPAPASTP